MQHTHIEWTNFTANPLKYRDADGNVVWGCIHASPGCQKCYSEALAKRYGRGGPFNTATMAGLTPFMDDKELRHMLTYKPASGQMCFVGDMTDLFGEWVPFELIDKLFAVFALRHDVTWQILTKRPERMLEYMDSSGRVTDVHIRVREIGGDHAAVFSSWQWPPKNCWLGVSVESQAYLHRIDILKDIPAAIRFVSFEPLLEDLGAVILDGIDWAIMGGESGAHARPLNIQWVRSLLRQCREQEVAPFVKQFGANPFLKFERTIHRETPKMKLHIQQLEIDTTIHLKDRKGGDISEWPENLRVREFPR